LRLIVATAAAIESQSRRNRRRGTSEGNTSDVTGMLTVAARASP